MCSLLYSNPIPLQIDVIYSVAATLDSIRHLVDEKNGMTREDVIDYLDKFADTLIDYDSVNYDVYKDKMGKLNNGLLFKKMFNDGTYQSFNVVSNKKKRLNLITMYMDKADYKKRSLLKLCICKIPMPIRPKRESVKPLLTRLYHKMIRLSIV